MSFDTKQLSNAQVETALDGSTVRVLCRVERGSMAHFTLAPGAVSKAVVPHEAQEVWYFISGRGRMWRQLGDRKETVDVGPGVSISIPAGTRFQFRSDDVEPLTAVGTTMPPYTPGTKIDVVEGPWEATV
jgi:mannose-6-phosphate isomerase-like protein (cupin superfamily)